MKMVFWAVYLFGELIDEVPYTVDCDRQYVYDSLVNHDGYDYRIKVKKCS
jgi:hypothetical protein